MQKNTFSLILATIDRPEALSICLESLQNQKYKNFEIIIVDQSSSRKTEEVVKLYDNMSISYHHVSFRGLSKARNYALKKCNGEYFALIDDDASYPPEYFYNASRIVEKKTILSGNIIDLNGITPINEYHSVKDNTLLSIRKIRRMAPSAALIIPYEIYKAGIQFDNNMGAGTYFGSGEETDFILQAIDIGYQVKYTKNLTIVHPTIKVNCTKSEELKKVEAYSRGLAALIQKDRIIRGNNRLLLIKIETYIKIFIKITGILGTEKKEMGCAEYRGLSTGTKAYNEQYGIKKQNT